MIVDDLHVVGVPAVPPETDPPPLVDPDAVLSRPLARKFLEPVPWWDTQVTECSGGIKDHELPQGCAVQATRKVAHSLALEDLLGGFVPEALDHG